MYILMYISAPLIADFFREPILVDISRVLFFVVIINSLAVVVRAKLTIDINFRSQAVTGTFATLFSSILAIWLVFKGYGYWALVWLILSKSILQTIGLWFFCRWLPKLVFNMQSFNSLFKFGSNLMIAGIVATLVNNLYVAVIGRFYSAQQVGYFTQANNLSSYLMKFIVSSLQGVTYPVMTSIKDDRTRLVNVYKKLISATMLVSLPILVGLAAIADDFVLVFLGADWLPAVPVLIALCIARSITPISAINMNILNAIGRSDLFLRVDLFKLPITLLGLYLALPYGIVGVAWATVSISFVSFFINAYYPGKIFGFGAGKQIIVASKYFFSSVVMYCSVILINFEGLILGLIAKLMLGVIVYFLMLFVLRDRFVKNVLSELLGHK